MIIPVLFAVLSAPTTIANKFVSVTVFESGQAEIKFNQLASVRRIYSEAELNGSTLRSSKFEHHEITKSKVSDGLGRGMQVSIRHWNSPGQPELRQTFSLYGERSELITQLELIDPSGKGSNRLSPLISDGQTSLSGSNPQQSLFVPYDNDNYFRFSSDGWDQESYEVGALYDDVTRHGLIVGSIDHDMWKSGVQFSRDGSLRITSGVTSKFTHDAQPHGIVRGRVVKSPRFAIGLYSDWRKGLERYGDWNATVQPALKWSGTVPFGWNSWSGHKTKVQASDADAATDFIKNDLPWLRSGGTAYINFDSFWDNLTREQRVAFVEKCHRLGLKAGAYWTPFVNWGEPDWKSVGDWHFRDMQLKDAKGELLPKLDGGWPLDPTHPGTLRRIDETLKDFMDQGFDYIKFDFTTHGALEGQHYDKNVMTGTQAYRIGMQRVVDDLDAKKVGRPVFISLSIAPMFPHGYGHSRRISCDVFSNIGASEYFLNSQNYAWWTADRLYRYNDADSVCVFQALGEDSTTEAEARTRFTASVIGGGMMIEGDNLTNAEAKERVKKVFSNRKLLELALQTPRFMPVSGATKDKAGEAFVFHTSRGETYLAVFNYDKSKSKQMSIPFTRLGMADNILYRVHDLWTDKIRSASNVLEFNLPPMDCSIVRLTR